MLRATGAKLGATIGDGAIAPGTLLIGCDLRDCILEGKDLRGSSLVGCFLSGASFHGALLDGAQFVDCFAPQDWKPVDFRQTGVDAATLRGCHVHHLGDVRQLASRWPAEAVAAAMSLTAENAPMRNEALRSLAELQFVTAAPLLAYLLEDDEWDVRLSTLNALSSIRGAAFPEQDAAILEWMFYALGDDHSTVATHMVEQIEILRPGDAILRAAVDQVTGNEIVDQLAGLRAARTLVYANPAYARLIDVSVIERIARAGAPEPRRECLRFAGYLGGTDGLRLVLSAFTDADAGIRSAALGTIALLDERPHALQVARLLTDPDEEVRTAAVYALNQCPDFSTGLLVRAGTDPSPNVRDAVAAVLADRRDSR